MSLKAILLPALLLASFLVAQSSSAAAARPNVLLVVTDDQGYGDASCYWKTDLQTPVMDGLARDGVRFTQFRVNPLCAPTRARRSGKASPFSTSPATSASGQMPRKSSPGFVVTSKPATSNG